MMGAMGLRDGACDECGFDYDSVAGTDAASAIRAFGRKYRAPLTRFLPHEDGPALLRTRPEPEVWSALEYAAHVRDVFASYEGWVRLILAEDRPTLEGLGPDELAVERRYIEEDPTAVADSLAGNAERLAATLETVDQPGWVRIGLRRGDERSVLFTARRAVHEGIHHLLDIGRSMRAARSSNAVETT